MKIIKLIKSSTIASLTLLCFSNFSMAKIEPFGLKLGKSTIEDVQKKFVIESHVEVYCPKTNNSNIDSLDYRKIRKIAFATISKNKKTLDGFHGVGFAFNNKGKLTTITLTTTDQGGKSPYDGTYKYNSELIRIHQKYTLTNKKNKKGETLGYYIDKKTGEDVKISPTTKHPIHKVPAITYRYKGYYPFMLSYGKRGMSCNISKTKIGI